MKKLVTSIMATAMILGVSSCGDHDFVPPISEKQQKYDEYDKAFTEAFGYVHPDQDWGFDKKSSVTKATSGETYTVPDYTKVPVSTDYMTEKPTEGVKSYADSWINSNYYEVTPENLNKNFKIWANNSIIYRLIFTKGEYNFDNMAAPGDGTDFIIYLLPGANVVFDCDFDINKCDNRKIYVASGASLTFNGKCSYGVEIYNKGVVTAKQSLLTYGPGIFYNEGVATINGDVGASKAEGAIVNVGTLTCDSYGKSGIEGSGLYNYGVMTVKDSTKVSSNGQTFVNKGTFTTGTFDYTCGSANVYNLCRFEATTFNMHIGDSGVNSFIIGNLGEGSNQSYGSVVADKFIMEGPSRIKMDSKTIIKAGEFVQNISKPEYGVYGIGDDWAVIDVNSVTTPNLSQEYLMTYSGKLLVDAKSHYERISDDGGYTWNYYYLNGAIEIKDFTGDIEILGSDDPTESCSPGYSHKNENDDPDDPVETERVFAEDLGAIGDWDFNDVVFDVVYHTELNYTEVVVQAAGGTMPLYLSVPNIVKDEDGNDKVIEVHEEFGVPTTTMVNTGGMPLPEVSVLGFIGRYFPADVEITVQYGDGPKDLIEITAERGMPAGKFVVPAGTDWQLERVNIKNNKNINFIKWVQYGGSLEISNVN